MMFLGLMVLFVLTYAVSANNKYKSRPDLAPPELDVKIHSSKDFAKREYLFFAPYGLGVQQVAPYIYDISSNELVWSGFSYVGGVGFNFQAHEDTLYSFEGDVNVNTGHGHGHVKFWDSSYKVIGELRAGNHRLADIHEFQFVGSGKSAVLEVYQPNNTYDLSAYASNSNTKWIINSVFQEIEADSGKVLFEWKSLDHVSPAESVLKLEEPYNAGNGFASNTSYDYFHMNSVDKIGKDYILSSRHTSTIYKVDGETGEILWRLSSANELTNFALDFDFSFQHHARYHESYAGHRSVEGEQEIISFFDNHAYSHGHTDTSTNSTNNSSGKVVLLDLREKTATLLNQYDPPEHIAAFSQGSLQILNEDTGEALINWGSAGYVTKYSDFSNVVFHARLDVREEAVQNYRAYIQPWSGSPKEDVAVSIEDDNAYISWNGDTGVREWAVYSGSSRELLGKNNKTGFETVVVLDGDSKDFFVRGLDASGAVVTSTERFQFNLQLPEAY